MKRTSSITTTLIALGASVLASLSGFAATTTWIGAGIPCYSYTVQYSPNVNGPWTALTNFTAGPEGLFDVEDTTDPVPPSRMYRVAYPSGEESQERNTLRFSSQRCRWDGTGDSSIWTTSP